jgi:hypothetical protein
MFVYERASKDPAFCKRWPTPQSFDAAAFKQFLGLNPAKQVVGIDHVPSDRPTDVRTVVREGSVDPDNDKRNQDRLYVENGEVVLDAFGRAVPYDPKTTWLGGLTGTGSQFHAHGGMLRTGKKGDGVWTAIRRPEQFARPAVVLGSAPEFSQTYTDLALLAKLWGGQGSEWLAYTYGGNNLHGIEDLGNQIHCTVLGTWRFFLDAKIVQFKARFKKGQDVDLSGYGAPDRLTMDQVGEAARLIKAGRIDEVDPKVRWAIAQEPKGGKPTDVEIGTRIISNHHFLLEGYVQETYLEGRSAIAAGTPEAAPAEIRRLVAAAKAGDADFEARCRQALAAEGIDANAPGRTPFARAIAEVMIEHSAPEAEPLYVAIRAISKKELKREGVYDSKRGHEPHDFITSTDNKHAKRIWELTTKAFARVVTAIRLWDEVFQAQVDGVTPGSPEALARAEGIAEDLTSRQMTELAAAEQRRADYLAAKRAEALKEGVDPGDRRGLSAVTAAVLPSSCCDGGHGH